MKTTLKNILILLVLTLSFSCKPTKEVHVKNELSHFAGQGNVALLLSPEINSPGKNTIESEAYADQNYFLLQTETERFKDNAPFIEITNSGQNERLWFTSSRADLQFYGKKTTNKYQQIYFCERTIDQGKTPNEGWSEPVLFSIETDNPYLEDFYRLFNQATKGAPTIANNTLIFSCDMIKDGMSSEFKNLWQIERKDGVFGTPKPIPGLSFDNTWESQPSLSVNGKHLFFVSNRQTDSNGAIIPSSDLNIYYSFNQNGTWTSPIAVDELNSAYADITPHISAHFGSIFFSSDRDGEFKIYEAELKLDDIKGGYKIGKQNITVFSHKTIATTINHPIEVEVNDGNNPQYPFIYYNPKNTKSARSIFWAANHPKGYGSFDIMACEIPFEVQLYAELVDVNPYPQIDGIIEPLIELSGFGSQTVQNAKAQLILYSGLNYQLKGGSTANAQTGTYFCNLHPSYIFIGYSEPKEHTAKNFNENNEVISGAIINSMLTTEFGYLPLNDIVCDTIIYDTIQITKAWERKPLCPGKLNIEPTHRSISYFQTGYWEVNTSENLRRDLAALHDGFEIENIYNPQGPINRTRSDYYVRGYEQPMFAVNTNDASSYSIANAPWIELHPNNYYWGDRPGFESRLERRMQGRKDRIAQYVNYAEKVDENLKNLTDTIKLKYINLLDLHKDLKPKLLIEIFAVSDQREASRSWYIGDTVSYRGSEYNEYTKKFNTEMVKIVPPKVNENTKTVTEVKTCTLELNADGDNGTLLGIPGDKTDLNTNLSRLRAYYGYKEVLKRLQTSDTFNKYMAAGKVALPDNNINYDDADIIIITRGKRIDGDVENPKNPYPTANNPSGNGYFDYDQIRRIEIQSRLLLGKEQKVEENYCCDPGK